MEDGDEGVAGVVEEEGARFMVDGEEERCGGLGGQARWVAVVELEADEPGGGEAVGPDLETEFQREVGEGCGHF